MKTNMRFWSYLTHFFFEWDFFRQICTENQNILLTPEFFFNFSTPCIQNVNNTGTKYVTIMKQTAFLREKTESIYHV